MFKLLTGMKGPICVFGSDLLNGPRGRGGLHIVKMNGGGGGVTVGKVPMETAASLKSPLPLGGRACSGSFQTVSV